MSPVMHFRNPFRVRAAARRNSAAGTILGQSAYDVVGLWVAAVHPRVAAGISHSVSF